MNHIDKLIKAYTNAPEGVKRKIILVCYVAGADSCIRELKEEIQRTEVWTKRAF